MSVKCLRMGQSSTSVCGQQQRHGYGDIETDITTEGATVSIVLEGESKTTLFWY